MPSRQRRDRHVYASRTRFVPSDILHLFEATTWPVGDDIPRHADQSGEDHGAALREAIPHLLAA